jgi:putative transposase
MARLPRLVVPGFAHYVALRGQVGRPVVVDDVDRGALVDALRAAAAQTGVILHAWAVAGDGVQLLATPPEAAALGRCLQQFGRRYVSAYHRRHGGRGTLWDGRYRAAVVEPGEYVLAALLLIDGAPGLTTASHRTGGARQPGVADPVEFWTLGNTPFEREAAYRALVAQGPAPALAARLQRALAGWVAGSERFALEVATPGGTRPVSPRRPGRKPKAAA